MRREEKRNVKTETGGSHKKHFILLKLKWMEEQQMQDLFVFITEQTDSNFFIFVSN